ncbi:TPA: DUF2357 domain-containing protein [Proteus mirabilis]|nr:DUF2357 domain-containing protein [Proteus mirabilis]MBG2767211.1 DUF2357 domain-containing protein [Proteus mirabilis]MBI6471713.1 DUF2357 domain-containing protein [Proteus mirabilis]MBI6506835.1 DUF2357 domain-containing protein [Proteus mirabilis]HEJ9550485.1 DUF2357 domain-containing protein [Proteus mirabilis]
MKIKISILGGKRQGDAFELSLVESKCKSAIFILEDEAIEISFSSKLFYDKVSLLLYENEMQPTAIEQRDDLWIYKWQPRRLGKFNYECFFHNYYGIAELALELKIEEKIEIFNFQAIEVLARKINAERVEKMLSFLAGVDNEVLCSFFRVTRRQAGYKHGDTPAEILLEQIENITENTSILVKKIINRPITKLSTIGKYVYPNDSTNVDDLTLSWLCNNIDELSETDSIDHAILEYNDNLYIAGKLIEHKATEDSDVYENQVIYGFINTLIQTASMLLFGFEMPEGKINKSNETPLGYISFFSQIQRFQKSINQRKILKCKSILANLHSIKRMLTEKIPLKKHIVGIPTFTMKAKKNPLYLSLFKKIVDWYRFGSPDWSVQEELLSIQSIPKLFEYYSLFYIKAILEKNYNSNFSNESVSESLIFSINIEKGLRLSLFYEPKYWMVNHPKVDFRGLVNTEGWTTYNGKVSKRSSSSRFSNRSPDFVIKINDDYNNGKYIILDAKYTYSDKAFTQYLPDLTLKYLHGLHSISNVKNIITGLMILNPDEESKVRDFHHSNFDVFSEKPALPFLLCGSISPGDEFIGNSQFENTLLKVVDLTMRQLNEINKNIYSLNTALA